MIHENHSNEINTIVSTLLQVSDRVVEVYRDHTMTRIWDSEATPIDDGADYVGLKIAEIRNGDIIVKCGELIDEVFRTGVRSSYQYTTPKYDTQAAFEVRILPAHPDKDFVFLVVSRVTNSNIILAEDKWKLALDAAGDGMWDMNVETDKMFFSSKWHEIFGYNANEITSGADWAKKIHPDDIDNANKKRLDYLSGKIPVYAIEIRYLCKDGTYKWILSRGVAISKTGDGKILRFIGTHTDINERKIAEEKYQSVAQLLSKLINNLQTGILVTDEHQDIIFANQLFCDIYRIPGDPGKLVGLNISQSIAERKSFYADPGKFESRIRKVISRQQMVLNDELELVDGRIISRDFLPLTLGKDNRGGIWKFRDITEQKNIDKRFEEQRKFYENILHNLPADIAVFDAKHTYLFVNRHAFKNEELRKWMIGKTDIDYAAYSKRPESFYKTRFAMYDGAIAGKQQTETIEKLINKQGEEEYHLRLLHPVFFENGSLEFLLAYGLNATELIVTQNALKTSADTFTSAFEHSGIGIALLGPDGMWLNVNNVLCKMTGYTKEELLARSYHEITFPDDDEIDRPLINKMLRKEISTYTIDKRYVSKEDKIVLVSITVSLVWNQDDTPKFFICQVVDITQKRELENAMHRKNAELEATRLSLVNKIGQLEELNHIIAHNLRGPAGNIKTLTDAMLAKLLGKSDADSVLGNSITTEQGLQFIGESSDALTNSLDTLMKIAEIKLNKAVPYDECDVAKIIDEIIVQQQSIIYATHAVIMRQLDVAFVKYPKAYLENILYNFISNALKYSKHNVPPAITITTEVYDNTVRISIKDNGLGIDMEKYGSKIFKLNQVFHAGYDSKGVGLYITKSQVESLGGSIDVKSQPDVGSEFIITL